MGDNKAPAGRFLGSLREVFRLPPGGYLGSLREVIWAPSGRELAAVRLTEGVPGRDDRLINKLYSCFVS